MSSSACFRFFVYPFIESILGLWPEKPIHAILKNKFEYNRKYEDIHMNIENSITKKGKIEVQLLSGQESFRIQSFVESNVWALLPNDGPVSF